MKATQLWFTEDQTPGYKVQWRLREVLHTEQTPFQELAIVDTYDFGKALLLDGIIQVTEKDHFIYNEMITHIPLSTHPNPRRVLIIGGGDGGALRECLKYETVERVDMVEIDERVVANCEKYLPEIASEFRNPRARLIFEDGLKYIKTVQGEYDVVIVDSSDPVGPAVQLFERPFYEDVARALKDDGLMVCQSESPFFNIDVLRKVVTALRDLFPIVRPYLAVIPTYPSGLWSFTLASKKVDPLAVPRERLKAHDTQYYNPDMFYGAFALPEMVKRAIE